jgi:hypothetical protein
LINYDIDHINRFDKLERATFDKDYIENINGKDAKVLVFKLNGTDIKDWKESKYKLESLFNCIISEIRICGNHDEIVKIVMLDMRYALKKKYYLPRYTKVDEYEIILGEGLFEKVKIDLNHTTNILVSGIAGSGKPVLIDSIVLQSIEKGHQTILKSVRPDHETSILEQISELREIVDKVATEVKLRKKLFRKNFVKNIVTFNRKTNEEDQLPRLIFAIDEFEMIDSFFGFIPTKEQIEFASEVKKDLISLSADISGTGVHIIISTQHRRFNFGREDVYRHFNTSICGYTHEKEESMLCIGSTEATRIPNISGRFFIKRGYELDQFQAYFVNRNDLDDFAEQKIKFLPNDLKGNKLRIAIEKTFDVLKGVR